MRNAFGRILLLVAVAFQISFLYAGEPKEDKDKRAATLQKTTGLPDYQLLNVNNVSTWMRSNGNGNFPPSRTGDGQVFPRGTGSVIYEDGFMWAAKLFQNAGLTRPAGKGQPYRVGGNEYNQGNQAGWILNSGSTATAVTASLPEVRAYRIRRDWLLMTEDELRRDAAEYNEVDIGSATSDQMAIIKARYAKDWDEWPVQYGGPYIERNGIPGYQKPPAFNVDPNLGPLFTPDSLISGNYDEPGVAGADVRVPADQVVWTAYNDLNRALTTALYGSEPMGLEAQLTEWAYKRTDALGNAYFRRIRLINKGGTDTSYTSTAAIGSFWMDSMYVCQWADPDLGNAGDDIIGCDTTLSLGFVYNGFPVDQEYRTFNLPPPAAGYDFLAGPLVSAPGDSGIFNLKRVYNRRNLGMSGLSYFSAGSAFSDPRPRDWATGAQYWWKMFRGFAPQAGPEVPYPSGPFPPSKFPFSGDPVTGTGFLDGLGQSYSFSPGDRRLLVMTGPFSLAPGDTQEIVVAGVVGLGADRVSSVAVMKFNDLFVQNTFNALFVVPVAPTPSVRFAELDRTVVLDWGWDPVGYGKIEKQTINPGGFVFEGYNVYQLPTSGADVSSGKRLGTFDLVNGFSVLLDQAFDQSSGLILNKPVQFGTNSGITRVYNFQADGILDKPALNDGQEYYLGVTAYFRSTVPGFLPQVLESSPARVRATPRGKDPGTRFHSSIGDTLKNANAVAHNVGGAEGGVTVTVVDPSRITGDTYRMTFQGTTSNKTYSLLNVTKGTTLFSGAASLGPDYGGTAEDFLTVEGMKVYAYDGAGVSSTVTTWSGGTKWIFGSGDLWGGDLYGGFENEAVIPGDQGQNHLGAYSGSFPFTNIYPIEIRFDAAATQQAYRLVRDANRTNNNYIIGRGYTGDAPLAPKDTLPRVTVPFTVWDVSTSTPRQLEVAFRDNNRNGAWNLAQGGTSVEFLLIYNHTYDPAGQTFGAWPGPAQGNNIATGGPLAQVVYLADFMLNGPAMNADTGRLIIRPKVRFGPTDQYTWSTAGLSVEKNNASLAKQDIQNITVYPNPYYAFNPAETNRFNRFVTFTNLPANAKIRIFNLAGQLIKSIEKSGATNSTQFERWDLNNQYGVPVASGIYIAHIEMPDLGTSKVLKLAIIQEQEVLDTY